MVPFAPLIFSTSGGLGEESTVTYKRIAEINGSQNMVLSTHGKDAVSPTPFSDGYRVY